MIGRACVVRSLTSLFLLSVATAAAPQTAWAKKLTLPQLLEMARGNPGLQANAAAISASEAQVTEAKLNWLPQGDLLSILAPSPNIQCSMGVRNCVETTSPEARITDVSWNKVFTRTEVKLIQPIFDFGKISAGIDAAEAGVGVSRQKEAGARADIELNVRKAYYGL
jgi:outer membrane protein TolC